MRWWAKTDLRTNLRHLWMDCTVEGQGLISRIEDFLVQLWLDGEIPEEFLENWVSNLQYCPGHELSQTWCAYCGNIPFMECENCGWDLPAEESSEDFYAIQETGCCRYCLEEIHEAEKKDPYDQDCTCGYDEYMKKGNE